jgi:Flp pilus assembly protein TadB
LAAVRPECMTESERHQREDERRSDAADTVALPMGMTLVLLPLVAAVTAVIALVAGLVTALAAVAATVLVTLQLGAVLYRDNQRGRRRRGRWTTLTKVAIRPLRSRRLPRVGLPRTR